MAPSLKNLASLQVLRDRLRQQEQQKLIAAENEAQRLRLIEREANLFRLTVGNVQPIAPVNNVPPQLPCPDPVARHHAADEQAALFESLSDEFTAETLLETDDGLSYLRPGVSHDVLRRLRRGQWSIQRQLDLHGFRREDARAAVSDFLRQAQRSGWRCVRIIHGKGHGSVNREPVLKHKVKVWLAQKQEVIAFCQATAADGGAGALIVLLRGRISTEK